MAESLILQPAFVHIASRHTHAERPSPIRPVAWDVQGTERSRPRRIDAFVTAPVILLNRRPDSRHHLLGHAPSFPLSAVDHDTKTTRQHAQTRSAQAARCQDGRVGCGPCPLRQSHEANHLPSDLWLRPRMVTGLARPWSCQLTADCSRLQGRQVHHVAVKTTLRP